VTLRPLVVVLAVQLVLAGVLVWAAATGFEILPASWRGGDGGAHARAAATAGVPVPRVDRFDAPRAMAIARRIVGFGPRPAGSPAARAVAAYLRPLLPGGRFQALGPRDPGLRNVVGSLPGRGAPVLVVAHYDTTPVAGYVGANNSAAAVGAVVEIARSLRREHAPAGARAVRFLLTDGEEAPRYPPADFVDEGLRGSRFAAARAPRPSSVIVLDFVGQRRLRIPREANSNAALWARLRAAARRVGTTAVFPAAIRTPILDDHVPFARRGIPAIDLIDFDYACWQKPCDTLDKLSVPSIDAAGETVLDLVRALRRG
jgi:glutaminyl-peptide cyclotransferase